MRTRRPRGRRCPPSSSPPRTTPARMAVRRAAAQRPYMAKRCRLTQGKTPQQAIAPQYIGTGGSAQKYRPSSCATLRGTLKEELILQIEPMIRAASMTSNVWRMCCKNTPERNPYYYPMGHYRHTPPAGAEGGPGPAQRGGRRACGHSSREVRSRERSRGAPTEPTRRRRGPRAPPARRPAGGRRRAAEGAHFFAECRPRRRGPVATVRDMGTCDGDHQKIL